MSVNELMLRTSFDAVWFVAILLTVYMLLAALLSVYSPEPVNRRNVWVRDNKPEHGHAYLLTVKTGTQWHAGTTAKVFTIIHGTNAMSATRELQSQHTGHLFVRGAVCSFILTTEEPLGNILKVQLWHNNRSDECHDTDVSDVSLTSDTRQHDLTGDTQDDCDYLSNDASQSQFESNMSQRLSLSQTSMNSSGVLAASGLTASSQSIGACSSLSDDATFVNHSRHDSTISQSRRHSKDNKSSAESSTNFASQSSINTYSISNESTATPAVVPPSSRVVQSPCCSSPQGCGSEAAWYVCEVSVAELTSGAVFAFPCFSWLSVTEEDARVEREISMETPTTFLQDVEHFLPQMASSQVVWMSLTSHGTRSHRLQRLTTCLVVCLCLATLSIQTVKRINTSHTMITPDLHVEPLYYGHMLALLLMPVQWIIECVFRFTNRMEEKESSLASVRRNISALKPRNAVPGASNKRSEHYSSPPSSKRCSAATGVAGPVSDTDVASSVSEVGTVSSMISLNVLDNSSDEWMKLEKWASNMRVENKNLESCFENVIRQRLNVSQPTGGKDVIKPEIAYEELKIEINPSLSEYSNQSNSEEHDAVVVRKQHGAENLPKHCFNYSTEAETKPPRDDDADNLWYDEVGSSRWRGAVQLLGWVVCGLCIGACFIQLFSRGIDLPQDYSSLWLQVIYITLCTSALVVQPLIVYVTTVCKVLSYRVKYRGGSCMALPLEQTVSIWRQYQTVLVQDANCCRSEQEHSALQDSAAICDASGQQAELLQRRVIIPEGGDTNRGAPPGLRVRSTSPDGLNSSEDGENNSCDDECGSSQTESKMSTKLSQLARDRELRFAHPPSEEVLLKCRQRELRRRQVNRCLATFVQCVFGIALLLVIVSNLCITQRFLVNSTLRNSIENGTCFSKLDNDYTKFDDIKDKSDWWYWSYTELMALTYNYDDTFSSQSTFCDTNSLLIGMPRIRVYGVPRVECDASHQEIDKNKSFTSMLNISYCYPDYKDKVHHLTDFHGNDNKKYEWDAHYLAVQYGQSSEYSYTKHEYTLPGRQFAAYLYLISLNVANWLTSDVSSRAIITEFTLYHPPTDLFSTVNFIAEFPANSAAHLSVTIESSHIQRYRTGWSYITMYAEAFLLPIAMFFLVKTTLYLYRCRLQFWKSFWGFLDMILMIFLWTYVVCLMLRVQITQDLLWQLKVSYYQKYVNLKSAMAWDIILDGILGAIIVVHLFRCIEILNFFKLFRKLLLILDRAIKDALKISVTLIFVFALFLIVGFKWLNPSVYNFHSVYRSFISICSLSFGMNTSIVPVEDLPRITKIFCCVYYVLMILILVLFFKAFYFAVFCFAKKTFVYHPRPVEISLADIAAGLIDYFKEFGGTLYFRNKSCAKQQYSEDNKDTNSIPIASQLAEVDSQLNTLISKLTGNCVTGNRFGNNSDASSLADVDGRGGNIRRKSFLDNFDHLRRSTRSSSSKRTRLTGTDNSNFYVDGMTEVPSCLTEVELTRRLDDGVRVVPQSLSELQHHDNTTATTTHFNRVYDRNSAHIAKFLNDVQHAASDDNIAGNHFSKYGKHMLKMKRGVATSKESMALAARSERKKKPQKLSSMTINKLMKNTETLGRCKNQNDFWELDYLDLSDEDKQ